MIENGPIDSIINCLVNQNIVEMYLLCRFDINKLMPQPSTKIVSTTFNMVDQNKLDRCQKLILNDSILSLDDSLNELNKDCKHAVTTKFKDGNFEYIYCGMKYPTDKNFKIKQFKRYKKNINILSL